MEDLSKAFRVFGAAASEHKDSQNEIFRLSGADLSEMVPKGVFNFNHSSSPDQILGKITEAKKILSVHDAKTTEEKASWESVRAPHLFVAGYLFEDHAGADAVAAMMRSFEKMGSPLQMKMSIEGKVLSRSPLDHSVLERTKCKNVALTLTPANHIGTAALLAKTPYKSTALDIVRKSTSDESQAEALVKAMFSESKNRWSEPTYEEKADELLRKMIALKAEMAKVLSPGYGGSGPPATRTGGAALVGKSPFKDEDEKAKALKDVMKTVLSQNPGVPLSKALRMIFANFQRRFA